jgi:hypothetical protein
VPLVSPENVSETIFNVFAVESIMISAEPVPGDAFAGDSAGPLIITLYVIGPAKRLLAISSAPNGIHFFIFIVSPPDRRAKPPVWLVYTEFFTQRSKFFGLRAPQSL